MTGLMVKQEEPKTAPFGDVWSGIMQDFIRMCSDGWEQGWHERNGDNLSK